MYEIQNIPYAVKKGRQAMLFGFLALSLLLLALPFPRWNETDFDRIAKEIDSRASPFRWSSTLNEWHLRSVDWQAVYEYGWATEMWSLPILPNSLGSSPHYAGVMLYAAEPIKIGEKTCYPIIFMALWTELFVGLMLAMSLFVAYWSAKLSARAFSGTNGPISLGWIAGGERAAWLMEATFGDIVAARGSIPDYCKFAILAHHVKSMYLLTTQLFICLLLPVGDLIDAWLNRD